MAFTVGEGLGSLRKHHGQVGLYSHVAGWGTADGTSLRGNIRNKVPPGSTALARFLLETGQGVRHPLGAFWGGRP